MIQPEFQNFMAYIILLGIWILLSSWETKEESQWILENSFHSCCWLVKLSYIKMQMKETGVKTLSNSSNWSFRKQRTVVIQHNHFEDRQFRNVTPLHVYQACRKKCQLVFFFFKECMCALNIFCLHPYKLERFLYVDEWDLISIILIVQFGFYQWKCWGLTASRMIPFWK